MPEPATEESARIAHLWSGGWIAAWIVGAVVWGLIIWVIIFHRRRSTALPTQTRYNLPIEVLYIIAPFIIVVVFFYFTARDESKIVELPDNPDQTINVVGRQWSWSFNYVDGDVYEAGTPGQPPTLYLPVGQTVLFELTSPDTIHSFWVPGFLFKMDVIPGRVNKFAITPNKEGTFAGKCAELCGFDHSRMLFNVAVVSPQAYEAHLAELRAKGQTGQLPRGILPGDPLEPAEASITEGSTS
ncbi:MAG: cytochrome c oxidase subunit II [Sporichthyaceae bacterium]|nr:cytochrome c oxidase subunit II [Sporichthyaceae bacterium]